MNKAKEIASGFKNLLRSKLNLTTEEEETLFQTRKKICNVCPLNKDGITCSMCGCVLSAKVRAINTSCPDGNW
jgi:hypothetical protein